MTKRKIVTRKLEDTSWLAQSIKDRMDIEFAGKRHTIRWGLHTLHILARAVQTIFIIT